jgi:CO/xanthine dehydrogenase Mo-binding subunit
MIERLIDIAADEMKIDPAELRRRNTIPPSAMPYKTPLTFTYDSGRFEENMDRAMKLGDWAGFEARRKERASVASSRHRHFQHHRAGRRSDHRDRRRSASIRSAA